MRFDKGAPIFDDGGFGEDMIGPLEEIQYADPNIKVAEEPESSDDDKTIAEAAEDQNIKR